MNKKTKIVNAFIMILIQHTILYNLQFNCNKYYFIEAIFFFLRTTIEKNQEGSLNIIYVIIIFIFSFRRECEVFLKGYDTIIA